ncbi:GNAT family N-acetyltransferase [Roseomonas sp. JC162]|uniref:GNAT family N-acetyltransferase n=1 Tax=Neoroseomonas marina TaxID=1232220 RepID=A0A848E6X6_9PROT|nr:GNAT family N-acetyltransferase [Neoroseomonas marina]NMJ40161.1 GNAT family N-acetyltransferase [Neoroseomonas marina]
MSAAMNALRSSRIVTTERLMMIPPGKENLPDLVRLKGDERVFGWMLHGVRSAERAAEELEDDIDFWEVRGYGTWCVFERGSGAFLGICGFMERPDGRGVALRYALWPECRGRGYAREAARASLAFGHRAGLKRIIAVARDENVASRAVLTDIGMTLASEFRNQGHRMLLFESRG